jgi:hypothetical protein
MKQKLRFFNNGIFVYSRNCTFYSIWAVGFEVEIAVYEAVKMPEDNTMELKIGMSADALSAQESLAEQLRRMADIQMKAFKELLIHDITPNHLQIRCRT